VTIVQEPLTSLTEDIEATKRVIDQQEGPVVWSVTAYGGSVITDAGADPKVSALVYVAALQPDAGEASAQLLSKFAAPNDAMRATPEKFFFIPAAKFPKTMQRMSRHRTLNSWRTRSSNSPRKLWGRLSLWRHGEPSLATPS